MTIYVMVIAVLLDGETLIFQYGDRGRAKEFQTKEACEKVLEEQRKEVPKLLAPTPGASMQAIRCIERQVGV